MKKLIVVGILLCAGCASLPSAHDVIVDSQKVLTAVKENQAQIAKIQSMVATLNPTLGANVLRVIDAYNKNQATIAEIEVALAIAESASK